MPFWSLQFFQKRNQNNTTWSTIVVKMIFLSFFGENWRHQKDILKWTKLYSPILQFAARLDVGHFAAGFFWCGRFCCWTFVMWDILILDFLAPGQMKREAQRILFWLNLYGCEAVRHKLKNSLKTQKRHFLSVFELMLERLSTI